jgi:hypothetical protein
MEVPEMKRIAPYLFLALAAWLVALTFGLVGRSPAVRAELTRRGWKLPFGPAAPAAPAINEVI